MMKPKQQRIGRTERNVVFLYCKYDEMCVLHCFARSGWWFKVPGKREPRDLSASTTVVKRLNSIMCSVPGEPSVCSVELVRAYLLTEISWPEVVALWAANVDQFPLCQMVTLFIPQVVWCAPCFPSASLLVAWHCWWKKFIQQKVMQCHLYK